MVSYFRWLIIMIAFMTVVSCGNDAQQTLEKVLRPIKYAPVSAGNSETRRSFSGISKAGSTSRVSFRVSGKLENIYLKEGDQVVREQMIAALDDSDARLQYEKAQSAVNKSKVYMETASSNLTRIKNLYENNNVSLNEYETAKEKLADAQAAYMADEKDLDLNKKEVDYFKVYAPISGKVSSVDMEQGENVSVGQVILEIHSMGDMEVEAGIPEAYISEIKMNDPATVSFKSMGDQTFNGRITEVPYDIDAESSTYPVMILILDSSDAIRPGMPATVVFDFWAFIC